MDRDLGAFRSDHHDHLEQVPGRVWADDKPAVGVFAGVFKCECMVDCVEDVCDGDAVFVSVTATPCLRADL